MTSPQFRVRVFGATTVHGPNGELLHLTSSMRRMLSFIVAAGSIGISADRALHELADGDGSATASSRLRMDISRLRKRIGADLLPTSSGEWRLQASHDDVDYFALANSPHVHLPDRPSRLLALLSGEPFCDAHPTALVEEAVRHVAALRQSLLSRACQEQPHLVDSQVLLAARSWVDADPLNEDLIAFVTHCHLQIGETNAARELLGQSLRNFDEMLDETSPSFLAEFEELLGPIRPARSGLGEPEPARYSFLDSDDSTLVVGREIEEAQLTTWLEEPEARPLLLHGVSGGGKTTLLRAVAHEANAQGQVVIAGAAREFDTTGYAAFLRALGSDFEAHLAGSGPPSQTDTWAFAISVLSSRSPNTVLIIDDAQWLDSLSGDLLSFLLRSDTPGLRLLICGRPTDATGHWYSVRREALTAGADELALKGLDLPGIEALVGDLRPEASLARQKRLATQVLELSNGLPGIACPLIREADEAMLRVTTSSQAQSLAWFVGNLSQLAKTVGQAAAILAQPLTYPSLAALTQIDDADLLSALEELVDRGVLRSDRVPGYLSFAHALIRDAFLHDALNDDVRRLHRRAAVVVRDVHRKAVHQLFSMEPGEEPAISRALIASADAYYTSGALSEAVFTYKTADELDATKIPAASLIRWAGATGRLHLDGSTIRQRAFDAAMGEGSVDLALAAACSGLPEAEDAAGDSGRISLLREIDADLLSRGGRFTHSATLGRQLMLTGDAQNARPWIEAALTFAETDLDLDIACRTKWLASFSTSTANQRRSDPGFFPGFDGETPDAILQLQAIDALASGDVASAQAHNERVNVKLKTNPDPITFWLQRLFESTLESAQGNHTEAAALSDEAMRHGTTYGLREAATAWLAQHFIRTWMTRGPEAFLAEIGDAQNLQVEDSPLAQASVALAMFRAGMEDDATALAHALSAHALKQESFAGVAILAVCARVLGPHSTRATDIYSFLEPLSGSLLVIGGGFACLGPVDLALAAVSTGATRDVHFEASRSISAVDHLAGWRDATELEITAIATTI